MIPNKKELKPIRIYMYICDLYDSELKYYYQRHSNNNAPSFTDQKLMTIYLFVGSCQKYFEVKDIHSFAKEYLSCWFPLLPSYQTFNLRLNRLSECFKVLSKRLIDSFVPDDCDFDKSPVYSMPIITCGGRNREAKVARELVTKGFCSTKNQYFYGLKLHSLSFRRKGTIPFPESITFTPAEDNDLTIFKQNHGDPISGRTIFGDKIYSDFEYFDNQKIKIKMLKYSHLLKASKDNQIKKNNQTRLQMIYFQRLSPRSDNP